MLARFVAFGSRNHILLADELAWTQIRAELRNFLGPAEVPAPAALPDLSNCDLEALALVASTPTSARDCGMKAAAGRFWEARAPSVAAL